jgi:cysteine dioxygenase
LELLATHIGTPTQNIQPVKETFSFAKLISLLGEQTVPPALEQINSWLEQVEVSPEELEPYLGFKEANYCRHRVCRNTAVEMLVLCWGPGHRTPIHDHNGSHGGVKVFSGILWETSFEFHPERGLCYKTAAERLAGDVTGAGEPDIHQLGNPDVSEQNLITIHIYAPPLGVLHTYKAGSAEVDSYVPNEAES